MASALSLNAEAIKGSSERLEMVVLHLYLDMINSWLASSLNAEANKWIKRLIWFLYRHMGMMISSWLQYQASILKPTIGSSVSWFCIYIRISCSTVDFSIKLQRWSTQLNQACLMVLYLYLNITLNSWLQHQASMLKPTNGSSVSQRVLQVERIYDQ